MVRVGEDEDCASLFCEVNGLDHVQSRGYLFSNTECNQVPLARRDLNSWDDNKTRGDAECGNGTFYRIMVCYCDRIEADCLSSAYDLQGGALPVS